MQKMVLKNSFEKLMNTESFVKAMEMQKFKEILSFSDNLLTIEMKKIQKFMNKAFYLGLSI